MSLSPLVSIDIIFFSCMDTLLVKLNTRHWEIKIFVKLQLKWVAQSVHIFMLVILYYRLMESQN